MFCVYCGKDRPDEIVTKEHVIPQALGGALTPTNPFLLDVCKPCNSACGRWVDGPFIRSFLVHNARAQLAYEYVDPTADPVLPVLFMGRLKGWNDNDIVCDAWIGPTGDPIYHFHRPYQEPTWVGRPPTSIDKYDPGVVFFAFVGTNPEWPPIVNRSIVEAFPGAAFHCLNSSPPDTAPPWPPVPAERLGQLTWVRSVLGTRQEVQVPHNLHFGDRFLVKLALGFATRFLGSAFAGSDRATDLRNALWAKTPYEMEKLEVGGTGFVSVPGLDKLADVLNWEGCHLFYLLQRGGSTAFVANIYGKYPGIIRVGDLTPDMPQIGRDGMVWLVAPGLRAFAGPMDFITFLAEKDAPTAAHLLPLRQRMQMARKMPPFHVGSTG